jgi:hypothetical protein
MVGRQPALRAEFSSAVLTGKREHYFVSAIIAPGHYCSVGCPDIKNSASGRPGTVILIPKRDLFC